jgi:hypothetical protein
MLVLAGHVSAAQPDGSRLLIPYEDGKMSPWLDTSDSAVQTKSLNVFGKLARHESSQTRLEVSFMLPNGKVWVLRIDSLTSQQAALLLGVLQVFIGDRSQFLHLTESDVGFPISAPFSFDRDEFRFPIVPSYSTNILSRGADRDMFVSMILRGDNGFTQDSFTICLVELIQLVQAHGSTLTGSQIEEWNQIMDHLINVGEPEPGDWRSPETRLQVERVVTQNTIAAALEFTGDTYYHRTGLILFSRSLKEVTQVKWATIDLLDNKLFATPATQAPIDLLTYNSVFTHYISASKDGDQTSAQPYIELAATYTDEPGG